MKTRLFFFVLGSSTALHSVAWTQRTPEGLSPHAAVRSTGLATASLEWVPAGERVFVGVKEADQGVDLNHDGDLLDEVLHRYELGSSSGTNLGVTVRAGHGLAVGSVFAPRPQLQPGGFLLFLTLETDERRDLNGDGDKTDAVLQALDVESGTVTSSGLALVRAEWGFWRDRELAAFSVGEAEQGRTDLNGDGDALDSVLFAWRLGQDLPQSLGLGRWPNMIAISGSAIVFAAEERELGGDRNADGDLSDNVVQVFDSTSGSITDLGLFVSETLLEPILSADGWFAFPVGESVFEGQGIDLNGDGDLRDLVLHTYDHATGVVVNLRRAVGNACAFECTEAYQISQDWLVFQVPEAAQGGRDLDRDGDASDLVLFAQARGHSRPINLRVAPDNAPLFGPGIALGDRLLVYSQVESPFDLNADGDTSDAILRIHRPDGSVLDTGLAASDFLVSGRWVAAKVHESAQGNRDWNGNGDALDVVLHVIDGFTGEVGNLRVVSVSESFSQGALTCSIRESLQLADLNGDGDLNDHVAHVYDTGQGRLVGLRTDGSPPRGAGRWRFFTTSESNQQIDLNADGDLQDVVLQVASIERRL